jgi:L-rhamnose-H+ transport protein
MNGLPGGLALILLSSVAAGIFSFPLRLRRRYPVDNMWLIGFLLGYLVLPHLAIQYMSRDWPAIIMTVSSVTLFAAVVFGIGWGMASIMFAHAIARVGLSLGFALIMSINTAFGSLIPLLRRWDAVSTQAAMLLLAGIGLCFVGSAVCGKAGIERERSILPPAEKAVPKAGGLSFMIGLVLCVFSGILSACANLGFEFAEPVAREFFRHGLHPAFASLGRWLPVYWGGAGTVLVFCCAQISRNRGWIYYRGGGAGLSLAMGGVLFLTQIPYGIGAHYLGALGTSIGWAINITASMIVANVIGLLAGEWKEASRSAKTLLAAGLIILLLAMILLALGNNA